MLIYRRMEPPWSSYPKVESGGLCRRYPYCSQFWWGCCLAYWLGGSCGCRSHEAGETLIGAGDGVLAGLLVLAAFALGVFLTYMVIVIA